MTNVGIDRFFSSASLWLPREFPPTAWVRNAPFAFWIMDAVRPRRFVELGTHHGFSYLCFCQAVDQLEMDTQCFAIDTWTGDDHAGFYGEQVLQDLRTKHDAPYSGFSRLVQSTFDEALAHIDDGSVDLLHIDGRHYYDDVKHDFETWLPKLSDRGVVLFHDINVRERDFGVHRLWDEVTRSYPSFALADEHGLGVLAVGSNPGTAIEALTDPSLPVESKLQIRALYQRLGEGIAATSRALDLTNEIHELSRLAETLGEREAEVRKLHIELGSVAKELEQSRSVVSDLEISAERSGDEVERSKAEVERSKAEYKAEVERSKAEVERSKAEYMDNVERVKAESDDLQARLAKSRQDVNISHEQLNRIYGSRSWRLLTRLRGQSARHPVIVGLPVKLVRSLRTPGETNPEAATGAVDWQFIEEQSGASPDRSAYLNSDPQTAPLPLRTASNRSIHNSDDGSVRGLMDAGANDAAVLNPLAAQAWKGQDEPIGLADLHDLSVRLPQALKRLEGTSHSKPSAKIDVLIPVFNSPVHVDRCIRSLYANTDSDILGTVYALDDASDTATASLLDQLSDEFGLEVIHHESNMGFVKNVNTGLATAEADLLLLLNTDCYVGPATLQRLASAFDRDENVGLASPIATNAPPVTLPTLPGFSYNDMERVLGDIADGATYAACTIVGNCLMLSRACFEAVGGFAEEWGVGYGEETDYQFRAQKAGFTARIAADAFVFHDGTASFGSDPEMDRHRMRAYDRFIDKWGSEYKAELAKYKDPVRDLTSAFLATVDSTKATLDVLIVLPALSQVIGGTVVAMDLAADLVARGWRVAIAVPEGTQIRLEETLPFGIIQYRRTEDLSKRLTASCVVATAWTTVEDTCELAVSLSAVPVYLVQGYEPIFASGESYEETVETYQQIENRVTVSGWLSGRLGELGFSSSTVVFGPDTRVFNPGSQPTSASEPVIGLMLRGSVEKGDPVLLDIVHRLRIAGTSASFVVLDPSHSYTLAELPDDTIIPRAVNRDELSELLSGVDIWIDASLNEGYGRLPVEAMASGAAVVMADTGGSSEYAASRGVRVVPSPTDTDTFLAEIIDLIANPEELELFQSAALATATGHTWLDGVHDFELILEGLGIRRNPM